MAIPYETFMKHAKKITDNAPEARPVLKGIYHHENGSAFVTDSHRLYMARNIHGRTDGAVLTPSGKKIPGSYPEVTRFLPSDHKQAIEVDVKDLLKAVDIIHSVCKFDVDPVVIDVKDNLITYQSINIKAKCEIGFSFEEPMALNAQYCLEALKMFNDCKCEKATIFYHGRMRPITIENKESDLVALILPVRRHA